VPLSEVIPLCTSKPTKAMGLHDRKGNLAVGRKADISVFDVFHGEYTFMDRSEGDVFPGNTVLSPAFTICNGRAYYAIHRGDTTP
jgi:predicted amidohydrolase